MLAKLIAWWRRPAPPQWSQGHAVAMQESSHEP